MNFTNLVSHQKYFCTELVCAQYLEQQRWNGKPECPHCGSEHHYRIATRLKNPELAGYKDFYCKACMRKYTVLTGTIYEGSKVSLKLWFLALYLLSSHKKGISSIQLAKDIGVTQKTAWFMLHRLREQIREKAPQILEGEISCDETFIGGRNKNRHWDKKCPTTRGRSFIDKTPVMGLLQKDGDLRCFVISDTKSHTLQPIIFENVKRDSKLYTDDWLGYSGMHFWYYHYIIDHSRHKYKKGNASTNNIEGVWTHLKKCLYGIYHTVSRKHLSKYCDEFVFRWNNKMLSDPERFEKSFKQINDTRVLYKTLVIKDSVQNTPNNHNNKNKY